MQKALFPGYTVGPDAYDDIVNICSAYGKKAAIIGGRKALAAAEPQIGKAVEGSGIEITGTFWYGGEASRENMDMLRPQVADADMIFAVGGGKAIDTCKVLAHETNRPFFTFPTIASTCASCTSRMICASRVSLPTFAAVKRKLPRWLTVPANTVSPGPLAAGTGSPVSMLSST